MKRGRKPNNPPATAYDYHRVIELVQVLEMTDSYPAIKALCEAWGVEFDESPWSYYMDIWWTIHKLAEHALEHARKGE